MESRHNQKVQYIFKLHQTIVNASVSVPCCQNCLHCLFREFTFLWFDNYVLLQDQIVGFESKNVSKFWIIFTKISKTIWKSFQTCNELLFAKFLFSNVIPCTVLKITIYDCPVSLIPLFILCYKQFFRKPFVNVQLGLSNWVYQLQG